MTRRLLSIIPLALSALLVSLPPVVHSADPAPTATAVAAAKPTAREAMLAGAAKMVPLKSDEGAALLDQKAALDYAPLAAQWIPQLKSHCGAASAVIVQNTLKPGAAYTQDGLFVPETAHIITQKVVYEIGFTLEELSNMITTRSGLKTTWFHAGTAEGEFGYDAWIAALKKNRLSPNDQIIINYAVNWLYKRENSGGHFSPVADYNPDTNQVLILEVNSLRESFWADAREIWAAMNQVDSVSGRIRGWIVIEPPPAGM